MFFLRHAGGRTRLSFVAAGVLTGLALAAGPAGAQTNSTSRGFASGAVTSVHGSAVQVSNTIQNSESTVTLQTSTEYTKRESATASAITVGACVRVLGTGSTTKGITAQTVAISPSTAGSCTTPGGPGGPGGGQGNGSGRFGNGQRPRNFGGANGNRTGNRPANFATAFGPVTSVNGSSIVVKSTTFVRPATTKSSSSTKAKRASTSKSTPKTTTSNVTVTLTDSSQISQTVSASASDVTVGACVTATGTSSGGGVLADRLAVSAPVNGQCTGGFGGFGRGGGSGAGTGTGTGGNV